MACICNTSQDRKCPVHDRKPTELDSMNALRVQAVRKAALYRRALELACDGDADKVAFFVSEAGTQLDERAAGTDGGSGNGD